MKLLKLTSIKTYREPSPDAESFKHHALVMKDALKQATPALAAAASFYLDTGRSRRFTALDIYSFERDHGGKNGRSRVIVDRWYYWEFFGIDRKDAEDYHYWRVFYTFEQV